MKSKAYTYATYIAYILIAFSVGRFLSPNSVQIKEVEKIVTKENEVKQRDTNSIETKRETRLPDGTVVIEVRKETESSTQTTRETQSEKQKVSTQTIENRPSYRVGVVYQPDISGVQTDNYSLTIERRMVSELYLGVQISLDKTVGVSVSLGF